MANKNLSVYPNPYAAIDHEGVPSGVVAGCPEHGQGGLVYPGVTVDEARTVVDQHPDVAQAAPKLGALLDRDQTRSRPQRTRWAFSRDPVELPSTAHYRYCLRAGDLIPADEATSQAVGLRHRDPLLALAAARQQAIDLWVASHGVEPHFASCPEDDVWPDLAPVCKRLKADADAARLKAQKAQEEAAGAHGEAVKKAAADREEALKAAIAKLAAAHPVKDEGTEGDKVEGQSEQ